MSFLKGNLPAEWRAKWIDPELSRPFVEIQPVSGHENDRNPAARVKRIDHRVGASYLRKTFSWTGEEAVPVRLYATAHGIYDIWINGAHVEGFLLSPGTSQYDKRLMVQCYEVTGLLQKGENTLLVSLGDGWYRGSVGNSLDINTFGDDLAFLCQVEVDGQVLLATDGTWEGAQDGPLGLNDMMRGEEYDARIGEGQMEWHSVQVRDHGYTNLIPTDCPPIIEHERFVPTILTTPAGETVLDFGQNFAGFVALHVFAAGGERIILTHGETLDESGNFTIENFQNPAKPQCFQRVTYICKPGFNECHPTKCYFGFRYVKVECDLPVAPEMFTGVAIYSDMAETASFSCGDERVNQLFQNVLWSMKSNFVGVPTDCPTREKSGFTGDAQVFCDTAITLMDSSEVLRQWLRECDAAAEPGLFRQVAPDRRSPGYFENSHGWCDAVVLVPWRLWKRTGDADIIRENYGAMKRWLDFALDRQKETRPKNVGRLPAELLLSFADMGFCWGEWLEPGADTMKETMDHMMHGEPEVATAYLSYSCRAFAEMAAAIGATGDSEYYGHAADLAREAYRQAFLPIESDRQCRYVRPIFMDLLTEEEKREAVVRLAELIHQNGDHLNTGFLSTGELCHVLTDYGQTGTAYDLLLQTDCPSWLYPVTRGATTIWERWEGIDGDGRPRDSLNHYSYGAVAGWLIDSVCGIRVERGQITIAPHPDKRLNHAKGEYASPLGTIRAEWHYEDGRLIFEGEVPQGQTACLFTPHGERHVLGGGRYYFEVPAETESEL